MRLLIIEEYADIVADLGLIDLDQLIKIIEYVEKNNLCNLGSIDLFNDTYFNDKQARDLKMEVKSLPPILASQEIVALINKGIDITCSKAPFAYLKFEV